MRLMILSDSHNINNWDLIALLVKHPVDYYIHCGDIFLTYENSLFDNFYLVRGNNDFSKAIPKYLDITLANKRFFITHGHTYNVSYDIDELLHEAKKYHPDIVCFGHTHIPYCKNKDGILVINPGSCSLPRGSYRNPTYCILDTDNMDVCYYDAITHQPCDPFGGTKSSFNIKKWFK